MDDLAGLIIKGLNGQHLSGFLPGSDNKAAISATIASVLGWCGGGVYGNVTRHGIGEWDHFAHHSDRKRRDATRFVSWDEVLQVVARGCADGHLEAYEAAAAAWHAECGPYNPAKGTGGYPSDAATKRLHETTHALIRHGCQQTTVQEALF